MAVTNSNEFLVVQVPRFDWYSVRVEDDKVVATIRTKGKPDEPDKTKTHKPNVVWHVWGEHGKGKKLTWIAERLKVPKTVLPKSALDDFLHAKSSSDIAAFVQKYGAFDPSPWEVVKQSKVFTLNIADFKAHQKELISLLAIYGKLSIGDLDSREKAKQLATSIGLPQNDEIELNVSTAISANLFVGTEPCLEIVDGEFRASLNCPDVLAGLYALLFRSFAFLSGWLSCPRCERLFKRTGLKKYCSTSCQEAEKQKRYRGRKTTAGEASSRRRQ